MPSPLDKDEEPHADWIGSPRQAPLRRWESQIPLFLDQAVAEHHWATADVPFAGWTLIGRPKVRGD